MPGSSIILPAISANNQLRRGTCRPARYHTGNILVCSNRYDNLDMIHDYW